MSKLGLDKDQILELFSNIRKTYIDLLLSKDNDDSIVELLKKINRKNR
jgi:hypothetical protein